MRKYRITSEEHDALFADPICAICKIRNPRRPVLDHDHKTGAARGLLCNRCNLIVGFIEKDTGQIASAIEYLKHNLSTAAASPVTLDPSGQFQEASLIGTKKDTTLQKLPETEGSVPNG